MDNDKQEEVDVYLWGQQEPLGKEHSSKNKQKN